MFSESFLNLGPPVLKSCCKEGRRYFPAFLPGMWSLFVLLTTANFPDVMPLGSCQSHHGSITVYIWSPIIIIQLAKCYGVEAVLKSYHGTEVVNCFAHVLIPSVLLLMAAVVTLGCLFPIRSETEASCIREKPVSRGLLRSLHARGHLGKRH